MSPVRILIWEIELAGGGISARSDAVDLLRPYPAEKIWPFRAGNWMCAAPRTCSRMPMSRSKGGGV